MGCPTRQLDRFGAPKSGLVEMAEQQQVRAHEGQECGVRLDDVGRRLTHGFLWRGEASKPPIEVPLSGDKAAQLLESPSNAPLTLDVNRRISAAAAKADDVATQPEGSSTLGPHIMVGANTGQHGDLLCRLRVADKLTGAVEGLASLMLTSPRVSGATTSASRPS